MTSAPVVPLFHFPITRPPPMDYDESALPTDVIRAAQSGDDGAFNTIIRACKRRLLGMAARYVQSAAELDELGQDIFVHIWKGLRTCRFDEPFPNWLSRVTINTCLTHIKRPASAVGGPSLSPPANRRAWNASLTIRLPPPPRPS